MAKEEKEITKFLKVRNVKSPSRSYPTDAGIDFYVPQFDKKFIEDLKEKNKILFVSSVNYNLNDNNESLIKFDDQEGKNYFILSPHSRVLIPSGIKSRMAKSGRALIATNKSGIASKYGLVVGSTTVDFAYSGEIHLSVINTSTSNVRIYEDMKIIQFIETPVITNEIEIFENIDNFYEGFIDDRKDNGFGSTDKK